MRDMVEGHWNGETKVMEFFYQGKKIGESPLWETIMRRRELQAEIDARQPAAPAPEILYFKQDGTPVYKRRKLRRA